MAHGLDDIAAQTECRVCGRTLNIPFKTLRLARTIDCHGCGEAIRPVDDSPIATIQKLIDETGN